MAKRAASLALCAALLLMSLVTSTSAGGRVRKCLHRRVNLEGATNADDPFLIGRMGRDVIHGQGGDDQIFGLPGNDRLCGGEGDDLLEGGTGFDRVNGGPGYDICRTAERVRRCEEFD